jgi:hypothetical protein
MSHYFRLHASTLVTWFLLPSFLPPISIVSRMFQEIPSRFLSRSKISLCKFMQRAQCSTLLSCKIFTNCWDVQIVQCKLRQIFGKGLPFDVGVLELDQNSVPGKVSGGVVFGTLSKHFCNAENLDATFCASKSCVCVAGGRCNRFSCWLQEWNLMELVIAWQCRFPLMASKVRLRVSVGAL